MWREIYTQAREAGVKLPPLAGLPGKHVVAEVRRAIDSMDDREALDRIENDIEDRKIDLDREAAERTSRAEQREANRSALLRAGLLTEGADGEAGAIQRATEELLEVQGLLDECALVLEAERQRRREEAPDSVQNTVQSVLADAASGLVALAERGVPDDYGIYAYGSRHSLADMRELHERLRRTRWRPQTKDGE